MVNDSQMQLAVQFSSEYAKDIKAGQTATISTSVGQVSAVVSSIDSASGKGTFLVVLTAQNPSGALAQGTSATATINSDSARHDFLFRVGHAGLHQGAGYHGTDRR